MKKEMAIIQFFQKDETLRLLDRISKRDPIQGKFSKKKKIEGDTHVWLPD
ncbi:hypothetical protein MGI18_10145 [Bacillus sp. OVS6]|nr:hypothetical protein MGI18_10145 [Bacillus sp. OVS6]